MPAVSLLNNNSLRSLLLNLGQGQLQNAVIEFRSCFIESDPLTLILGDLQLSLEFADLSLTLEKDFLQFLFLQGREFGRSDECSGNGEFPCIRIVGKLDSLLVDRGEREVYFVLRGSGIDIGRGDEFIGLRRRA